MFNIQAPLQIIDLTQPYSPCAIPSHMGPAEDDTLVVFGPMPTPIATIFLSPPNFVVTPLDKADYDVGDMVKSPSVTPIQLAMIEPLFVNPAAVEATEPSSSRGPHDVKKCVKRWPWNDKFPKSLIDNTKVFSSSVGGFPGYAQQTCQGHMSRFPHAAQKSCSCKFLSLLQKLFPWST